MRKQGVIIGFCLLLCHFCMSCNRNIDSEKYSDSIKDTLNSELISEGNTPSIGKVKILPIDDLFTEISFFPGDSIWINNRKEKIKFEVPLSSFSYPPWKIYDHEKVISVTPWGSVRIDVIKGSFDEDGFYYSIQRSGKSRDGLKRYFIRGGNYIVYQYYYRSEVDDKILTSGFVNVYGDIPEWDNSYIEEMLEENFEKSLEADLFHAYLLDDGIQSVSASSSLAESAQAGGFVYSPEKMLKKYAFIDHPEGGSMEYRNYLRCWAEGVDGPGIGEYVDIVFSRDSDRLIVLNGYVDILRRSLYKDNSRPKIVELRSESPEFTMEYEFEDVVKFHEIALPEPTRSLRMTIKDVYPGRKYDDTCVSAVMLPQERWRSEDEERAELFAYLVEIGAWETMRAELEAGQ
ncbi:MAG: hypothetical protein KBB32_06250 [Spirochaetia bacterium]|nr:hypothetical protein [Spirochaetia bacterium]